MTPPAEHRPVVALSTLHAALRREFARALRPPYEVLGVIVGNGLLMTLLWTLLPTSAVDAVFTLHGPLTFALVLATWMYSDVPSTNLLGADPEHAIAALPDPLLVRRLFYAKNIVMWAFVTPLCTVIAIIIGIVDDNVATALLTVVWIAVVPLGALGFSAWLGIWYPYHPLPLRYRWAHRRRWRPMIARWLVLVLVPYGLVPILTVVLTLPTVLLWIAIVPNGGHLTEGQFAIGLAIAAVLSGAAWVGGHHLGSRLAHRRRTALAAALADPDSG